ncbi:hypothetical protein [Schaalia sp. lx-260]|uniref:hypothetical protein n=1 Tax=Schaalia sp. lx-260 TaxID=2899082 RepID=UPI001E47EAEE|nr:hypothetical protein [Schaalia sp. lx-260]MCD4550074.1 hypothetical protein [Schaalia sp. lx-260]
MGSEIVDVVKCCERTDESNLQVVLEGLLSGADHMQNIYPQDNPQVVHIFVDIE